MQANRVRPTNPFTRFEKEDIEQSIPARFEQMATKYPDRLAVKTKDRELTYRELNQEANRVAHAILANRGEGEESVAILLEDDARKIAAFLGVLKSGKIYVPLDPLLPAARRRYILEDSGAKLCVTNNRNLHLAKEMNRHGLPIINIESMNPSPSSEDPELAISPDTAAWLIYTSGSTGEPKGVTQTHRNVLHFTMNYTNGYRISPTDRLSLLFSFHVNAAAHETFVALLNGASLFPFNIKEEGLSHLAGWMVRNKITTWRSVPTLFRHFAESLNGNEEFPDLRLIRIGGEPVYRRDAELYKKHFSPKCLFVNRLGSTETGTIRWYFVDKETPVEDHLVPTGDAVPDNEILLLDENLNEVAPGEVGEIVVRSRYLSPGYWRKPEITKDVFLPDPAGGSERIYRTGDLGRMLSDGRLVHMGRMDHQVKVRGYRIEVAEIEMALLDLPAVKETVVLPLKDKAGDQQLVAYFVPANEDPPTVSALRQALEKTLPSYMIPSSFMAMKRFPLAPNGKVNRKALPSPGGQRPELDTAFVPLRNPIEEKMTAIWAEVLGLDQIGINDPFLELGGDSLRAMQVISRVIDRFHVEIPITFLFEAPTVAEMSAIIAQHLTPESDQDSKERLSG